MTRARAAGLQEPARQQTAGRNGRNVVSHLHQDHIGGLAELSHADIVVSQAEWDTLSRPLPEMRGLMRRHIDLAGLRWKKITPEGAGDPGLAPFLAAHDPGAASRLARATTVAAAQPGRSDATVRA